MVGVEQWAEIRRLHRVEQLSIREISRRTGLHRRTIRRALSARSRRASRRRGCRGGSVKGWICEQLAGCFITDQTETCSKRGGPSRRERLGRRAVNTVKAASASYVPFPSFDPNARLASSSPSPRSTTAWGPADRTPRSAPSRRLRYRILHVGGRLPLATPAACILHLANGLVLNRRGRSRVQPSARAPTHGCLNSATTTRTIVRGPAAGWATLIPTNRCAKPRESSRRRGHRADQPRDPHQTLLRPSITQWLVTMGSGLGVNRDHALVALLLPVLGDARSGA